MRLSANMLYNASSVNAFLYVDNIQANVGDQFDIYFQLTDLNQNPAILGYKPPGLRYMPDSTATLMVTLDNIDSTVAIVRAATQPFSSDPSIWKVSILNSDTIRGTIGLALVLTEASGTKKTYGRVEAAILIGNPNNCL